MDFLHTMVRISDIKASLKFYCEGLGLKEVRRVDNAAGRFTLIFLTSDNDLERSGLQGDEYPLPSGLPMLELTYNWPTDQDNKQVRETKSTELNSSPYSQGRNFGHIAYRVDDIYALCKHLTNMGIVINRPPRDGRMAFMRSPDNISIELLQRGEPLPPQEPWLSQANQGQW